MLSAGTGTGESDSVACIPVRASTKPSKHWREKLRKKNPEDPNLGHPRVWLLGDAIHAMQPTRFVYVFKQPRNDCSPLTSVQRDGRQPGIARLRRYSARVTRTQRFRQVGRPRLFRPGQICAQSIRRENGRACLHVGGEKWWDLGSCKTNILHQCQS